jgi:hypothetical protein
MVKKTKGYTDDKIQQFKPHIYFPDVKQNIKLPPLNRFRVVTGIPTCHILDLMPSGIVSGWLKGTPSFIQG